MDCVRPILDVATRLWDSAAKRPVYIRHLPQNLNSLRTEMEELKNLYEDVKESYNLGKMVLEKMDAVTVKKTEGSNFSVVAEPLPSPPVMERQLEKTVGQDLLFGKVWKWLQDGGEQVSSIGLYGMGGVGKTTLLTRINNELLKTRLEFDAVIWVTVSRPANVEKVQRVLFNKVEIPQDKWEVGIPPLNPQDKLKMVLTTRSKDVCQDMEVTESIEMNCLPWEDAFALFQTKVGADTINSHPDIPSWRRWLPKSVAAYHLPSSP
ncbi:putative disease resistance protein [Vitis vinifera]|uniref:Putative disease resistance protein n=1 Tax=Vitis vinifera TaxID=29760 RepID=A0A438CNF2_VITVI|nr:putative disease resistance protein [Vitis vinifera]